MAPKSRPEGGLPNYPLAADLVENKSFLGACAPSSGLLGSGLDSLSAGLAPNNPEEGPPNEFVVGSGPPNKLVVVGPPNKPVVGAGAPDKLVVGSGAPKREVLGLSAV